MCTQLPGCGCVCDAETPREPMVGGNTIDRFNYANHFLQRCEVCEAPTRADFDGIRCTECTWKFFY